MNLSSTDSRIQAAVVLVAVLVIGIASTYHLTESPAVWYDEGYITQTALNLERFGVQGLQVAPGMFESAGSVTTGFPLVFPVGLSYKLFGVSTLAARSVMVLFISAFSLAAYWLMRKLFGPWIAAWTLLFLAAYPSLYGDGKSVLGEVPGLAYLTLALLAANRLEASGYRSMRLYALFGLAIGLCVVTKPIFLLFGPAILIAWFVQRRCMTVRWDGIALAVAAFALPILAWFYLQFGTGDTLAHTFSFYLNPYHTSESGGTFLANAKLFVTSTGPLYTLVATVLWTASLLIRKKNGVRPSIAELIAYVFVLCISFAFLRLPGWSRYIFPATMLALLFVPKALHDIYAFLAARIPALARAPWVPAALIALAVFAQCTQIVHGSYVSEYYLSTRTVDLERSLGSLPPDASVFVYNAPEVVTFLDTSDYFQYIHPHDNGGEETGLADLPVLQQGGAEYAVVTAADRALYPSLFSAYDGGTPVNRYLLLKKKP